MTGNPGDGEDRTRQLEAAALAAQELGPVYRDTVVEQFLDDLDARITTRHAEQAEDRSPGLLLPLGSIALGIPVTGAASSLGGTPGLIAVIAAWLAIAAINLHPLTGARRRG